MNETDRSMLTPREIVSELDKYIVGQNDAKRAVAVALRNRWRRSRVPEPLHSEITPKNILMIGPTGVGKTEIARRLAKLTDAPFVKTEATKFTEVGYVGRNVESIVRDLMQAGIKLVEAQQKKRVMTRAREQAEERVLDLLLPPPAPVEGQADHVDVVLPHPVDAQIGPGQALLPEATFLRHPEGAAVAGHDVPLDAV